MANGKSCNNCGRYWSAYLNKEGICWSCQIDQLKAENKTLKDRLCDIEGGLDWCCSRTFNDPKVVFAKDVTSMLRFMRNITRKLLNDTKKEPTQKELTDRLRGIHQKPKMPPAAASL